MLGICVAVNATTSYSGRSRYTRLKLWKSRPAAPAIRTRVLAMHRAYASSQDGLDENLPNPLSYCLHLQSGARDLLEHLLGPHALALAPELPQQRPGLARGEPARPELLHQERPQLRLEGPGAQVGGNVEAGVDVREVVRGCHVDLERVREEFRVAAAHGRDVLGGVELDLVQDLRRV